MAVNFERSKGGRGSRQGFDPKVLDILEHHASLEDTLPPTPLRELLSASGATLAVLATDPAFIDTIQRAAGEQYPILVVDSWPELRGAVESARCGIALVDAELLGGRAVECIDRLAEYSDRLVVLVAAERDVAHEFVSLLSDRRIHRLLIKPPAAGAARLLIDSAVMRRLQLREQASNVVAVHRAPPASEPSGWPYVVAASAVALVVIGAVAVATSSGWWQRFVATDDTVTATAAPTTPAQSGQVEALFTRAEQALHAESLAVAAATLDQIRRVQPASSRLAVLDAQLARTLAAQTSAAAAPAPLPPASSPPASSQPAPSTTPERVPVRAAPNELDRVLSLTAVRLERGDLLTPAGDSARDYFERAVALDADDLRVMALRSQLGASLVAAARLVADADPESAANMAAEAFRLGAELDALAPLDADIAAARARRDRQRLQAAVGAIEEALGRRDWAAAESAIAALAHVPQGSNAASELAAELAARRLQETYLATPASPSELMLRSSVPVVYPPEALARGVEGWVDVEFVVDTAGIPRNLAVVRSFPVRRFDDAALAAVEQYRYVPFERDGRVYERRVRLRVRFDIE